MHFGGANICGIFLHRSYNEREIHAITVLNVESGFNTKDKENCTELITLACVFKSGCK